MNYFASQLKWMLGGQPEFKDAKYVGRACFVPLSNGTNIKAEFVTRGTHQKYEAIKLTAINKEDGQIDSTILDFKDFCRSRPGSTAGTYTPHIWTYNDKSEWYGTSPSYSEKEAIGEAASEYVQLFTPEQEEANGMNMTL